MVADEDTHTGDSTPECVACAQPCVQEQTRWVCRCCGGLLDCIQPSFADLGLGGTPPAHHIRESRDSPVVGCFSPTSMTQDGTPGNLRAIHSNGTPHTDNNHHYGGSMASPSRVGAERRTFERQKFSFSPQIDGSVYADVSSGTQDVGDDDQDNVGDSDEDMDLEDVVDIDKNNEGVHRGSVDSWLQGTGSVGMVERFAGIKDTLRDVGVLVPIPRTPSNMAQYDGEAELSDGMEMDE
ncbi:hypothetical protein NW768_003469 [Fusarium equiseti]|uniref:Uncharacterized protein n=1 Tax=Fusarium equiseti TaxID=61235 RepID=A0ABQ8RHT0_FUSEQ|nr:hypothetical protein NW768_003469 [Fusarium equiseti]